MKTSESDFKDIERAYPNGMSKDQFYKVAHISKATALYLLKSGLVPCKDSGKQTRRYKIKTEDVLNYLKDRELDPRKYEAPAGWYKPKPSRRRLKDTTKEKLRKLDDAGLIRLKAFFEELLVENDDLLTAEQVSAFLGYSKSTVVEWCVKKRLKSFMISGKYMIPRASIAAFLASEESFRVHRKTSVHINMLKEFLSKNNGN